MNTQQFMAVIARKKAGGGGAGVAFGDTLDADTGISSGVNYRVLIPSSELSNSGTEIRATLQAANSTILSGNYYIDSCYIGHASTGGNAWDFDGNQVQLFFSSSSGTTISIGNEVTTDYSSFSYNNSKDLIVSVGLYTTGGSDIRKRGSASTSVYQKASAYLDAGKTAPSGYGLAGSENWGINEIEVQ